MGKRTFVLLAAALGGSSAANAWAAGRPAPAASAPATLLAGMGGMGGMGSMPKPAEKATGAPAPTHARAKSGASVFDNADNFTVDGTVASLDSKARRLTIARGDEALPVVSLPVQSDAAITIDGQEGKLSGIRRGADVRATFNLSGDKLVVVSLDVTSAAGTAKPTPAEPMPKDGMQHPDKGMQKGGMAPDKGAMPDDQMPPDEGMDKDM